MKTELQAKFLHHLLNKKKGNEGFTLIELLVVIIIIGILAAIALPSFLNQANKARESEAKTYVGSMNRGQQAYYLEEGVFGTLDQIGIGIPAATTYYKYDSAATSATTATSTGTRVKGDAVKNFTGVVTIKGGTSTATLTGAL